MSDQHTRHSSIKTLFQYLLYRTTPCIIHVLTYILRWYCSISSTLTSTLAAYLHFSVCSTYWCPTSNDTQLLIESTAKFCINVHNWIHGRYSFQYGWFRTCWWVGVTHMRPTKLRLPQGSYGSSGACFPGNVWKFRHSLKRNKKQEHWSDICIPTERGLVGNIFPLSCICPCSPVFSLYNTFIRSTI